MGALDPSGVFRSTSAVGMEVSDQIAVITLANPPVNAIDTNLVHRLGEVLDEIEMEASIRAVIVTGAGEMFSAGSDIVEISTMLGPGSAVEKKLKPQFDVFGRLAALPVPTIAALNGHALGGGLEVAVCCDLIVADERAKIGSPEIRVGLFPSSGGTFRVSRRIGPGRAKEMQMLGLPISAATAAEWGLVNRVAAAGRALAEAHAIAKLLLERPLIGLSMIKRLVDSSTDLTEPALIELSLASSEQAFTSADGAEGIGAFIAKRPAHFGGSSTTL